MSDLDEFVWNAAAEPSVQPDRPPEPEVFEQTEWEAEGEGVFTLVYSAGDNDDGFLLARPEDVQSLTRWR